MTCDQKPTWVRLIYSMEQQRWRTGRLERGKTDMLRSIGKQSGESAESVRKKKGRLRWEGFAEKESFDPGVEEWRGNGWWKWWVNGTDGGSAAQRTGWCKIGRSVRGWRRKAGSWFQRRGETYWKEHLLFVEKMVWMDERVWPKMKSECCEEAKLSGNYADMMVGWLWELCK